MSNGKKIKKEDATRIAAFITRKISIYCEEISLCGSYRRGCDKVGDLDFVVVPNDSELLKLALNEITTEVLTDGNRNLRIIAEVYNKEVQVDFLFTEEKYFESAILHSTGSKWFNVRCRQAAQRLGMRLSEYGLRDGNGNLIEKTELGILTKLGMEEYIQPFRRNM